MSATRIVNDYLAACTSGDANNAARLVTEDFSFRGPMQASEGRDALRSIVDHLAPHARGCRILRQWEDGEHVCTIYEFKLEPSVVATPVLVSEWNTVREERVATSVMVFDTGPFRPTPRGSTVQSDPVCGMAVEAASAGAHRVHGGRDYYFCNPTCAEQFDHDPERYILNVAQT